MTSEMKKGCTFESCHQNALLFSDPPRCASHIDDMDEWYKNAREKLSGVRVDDDWAAMYSAVMRSAYMAALSSNEVSEELYRDFEARAEPPEVVCFSTDHFVSQLAHFFVAAALGGIVGNVSYAAVRALVTRLMKRYRKQKKPEDDRFGEIVTCEKYEEIRRRVNFEVPPFVRISKETASRIKIRYFNIVEGGFSDDHRKIHSPKRKEVPR